MRAAFAIFATVLALAGCDRGHRAPELPALAPSAASAAPPNVDYLVSHPKVLANLHRRCKARAADATPDLCAVAAEATRKRFLAPGPDYAPKPVQPFGAESR